MTYEDRIKNTKTFKGTTGELLKFSIDNEDKKETGCIGWGFLKENLTEDLKEILINKEYLKLFYNSENINFIIDKQKLKLSEELKSQLGSLVFIWKDIKRDLEKEEAEEKLKEKLLSEGFKEFEFIKDAQGETQEELNKRRDDKYRVLDGLKVKCVLDVSKIGIMGSFDKTEEIEGKFSYSEHNRRLMIIPKRCRTRGYLIRSRFYFKEI